MIEGVDYNLPKVKNSRWQKCLAEKEVSIREAVGYFCII